jgi:hypothetical protein
VRRLHAIPVLIAAFMIAPRAEALPVQFQELIQVSGIFDPTSLLTPLGVTPGSLLTLTYTFESTTPDADPNPNVGTYTGALLSIQISFPIGGPLAMDATTATSNTMFFVTEFPFGVLIDGYAPDASIPLVTVGGVLHDSVYIGLYLATSDTTLLPDDSTQTSQPVPPPVGYDQLNQFTMEGFIGGLSNFRIDGFAITPVPVPEPSTALLVGFGLIVLGRRRNRR